MANPKFNCGTIVGSACVPFTGKDLTIVTGDDQVKCDSNINDVIEIIDAELKKLKDSNDFTGLTSIEDCIEFNPATVTAAQLHELELTKICELNGELIALQSQFNDWDISTEIITINLPSCFEADAAPCEIVENEYTLLTLLTLYANKICELESRIIDLES